MADSEKNALPDPELNPMLNPLLSANMGRWAEVYFTSPPERRGQAVAELIRELRGNPSSESIAEPLVRQEPLGETAEAPSVLAKASDRTDEARQDLRPPEDLLSQQRSRICEACSYENSEEQNFCGMCGSPLLSLPASVPAEEPQQFAEQSPPPANWEESEPFAEQDFDKFASNGGVNYPVAEKVFEREPPKYASQEDVLPQFASHAESTPYRYRLYVGTVLAVLLVLLVYMSWRGTKAISGTSGLQAAPSRVMPPAPSAVTREEAAAPAPTPKIVAKNERPAIAVTPPREKPLLPAPHKKSAREIRPAARIVSRAAESAAIASEQSSQQDLATAQQFLHATPRDSKQASMWLWKAVSKGNPTATMELSDLYLRGDGVPKSCDQARVLLDAAARKGQHAAAERIRNLPAFGCQ